MFSKQKSGRADRVTAKRKRRQTDARKGTGRESIWNGNKGVFSLRRTIEPSDGIKGAPCKRGEGVGTKKGTLSHNWAQGTMA